MDRRRFLLRSAQSAAAFGILRQVAACRSIPASMAGPGFSALRERYFVKTLELNPVVATYLGGDAYAPALAEVSARLRNYAPAALAEEAAFYRGIRAALGAISPASLPAHDAIDHRVITAQVAFLLHQIEDLRYHQRSIDTYVQEPFRGVDWQIQQMTSGGGSLLGTEPEWRLVVRRLDAIPGYLQIARSNLLAGKAAGNMPDRRMVQRDGINGSKANVEYFRTTLSGLATRYLGSTPYAGVTKAEIARAGGAAADAYAAFADFLAQNFDVSERVDRFAIGEPEYEWRLRNNLGERRSAAELYEYGASEVAKYESMLMAVAKEVSDSASLGLAFDTPARSRASVRKVLDYLSKQSPASDDELFRWYREAGERAVAYGRERNLFDIPSEYRLDVVPTPPVLRSAIDAAYYPAPPFKKSGVGRFYLTPTDNDAAALAENNKSSVADTAVHEGFPGHDWHYKYMTEHAADISNVRWLTPGAVEDSSSMWEDSMAAEGWGLYAEELMSESAPNRPHGFYTAGEYLYELQGQLLRAVRVRVDVGMHTGRMTFDDAMNYFTEHVAFYPNACANAANDLAAKAACDSANRAIYRYSKWPTQAITYNLGKNAIVALREAYRAKKGSAYSAKEFHQRFMRMGTIPVAYFRDAFLAET